MTPSHWIKALWGRPPGLQPAPWPASCSRPPRPTRASAADREVRPTRSSLPRSFRIATLALLQIFLAAAQTPRPPASWLDPDRTEPAGATYSKFASHLAGGDVSYLVYLPPDYESATERRYPVVYWLHGLGGNQRSGAKFISLLDWSIRTGRRPPSMIVVLVNGMRDSFYNDSPDSKWPIESVVIKELIPHIDQTYRTISRRQARAIEGYSMGGYGAAHLGFKYPDLFGIVGVMAGALITPRDSVQPTVFQKMFGSDPAYVQANDPFALVRKNADAIRGKTTVRIAVGDQDSLQVRNQALHELLGQLKIEHEYEVVPGVAHNSNLFYEALGERVFAWYRKALAFTATPSAPVANASAPSHVFKRGDVEILTYETEQNYDRLQELCEQSQKTAPTPGVMSTRYYRSNMDGSVQPYAIRLPRDYTRDRKYPLVIQLHGTNFHEVLSGARLQYRGMGGPQWIVPDLPVIYVDNFGRPTTFYQGMGEADILEMIEEVKRQFSVDPDRIFIMGHSMGGAGSYTVGLHHPDLFGGILAADPAMWSKEPPPEDLPAWMKPQIAISSVAKLYPNARNVDVFFKNAGEGLQGRSTEFNDGIVAQGGFATSESLPGMPHAFGNLFADGSWVTELIQHPVRRHPAEVKFYTNSLQWNQAYWVTIDRLTRHNADASVTATYREGSLRVKTVNIDALTLRLADTAAPKGSVIKLIVDAEEIRSGTLPDTTHLSRETGQWSIGEWSSSERSKRHGLQGPIGDAFNSRFLAVYGERDRDLAITELDAIRNPPGPLDIHADFPMKSAGKVTREDIASSNLILFGTQETNPVLKRIASALPSGLMRPGAIFIYPNPENPARYVVVWSAKLLSLSDSSVRPASWSRGGLGLSAGWIMPLNLLPDYMQVQDGKIVAGGHFDTEWKMK